MWRDNVCKLLADLFLIWSGCCFVFFPLNPELKWQNASSNENKQQICSKAFVAALDSSCYVHHGTSHTCKFGTVTA